MDGKSWLNDMIQIYKKHKLNCEKAASQVNDVELFSTIGGNPQSIAALMKHIGGNHRSRWRDFLTTDGEKSDRNRESEFALDGESRDSIIAKWEDGWSIAFETLNSLDENDLEEIVTIRGEPFTVVQAIERNLVHISYHAGQIVMLARSFAGENWQTLSVAVGKSEEYNNRMKEKYGDWMTKENN